MIIDANVYWLPDALFADPEMTQAFLRCVPREYDTHAFADRLPDGRMAIRMEKPLGCENLNYFEGDYALKKQLADMDAAHVDKAVMKLPGCQEWLTLELCRAFNNAAAKHAKESNGRLIPLAVIPPYGEQDCLDELDRCVHELHMHGVQMSASSSHPPRPHMPAMRTAATASAPKNPCAQRGRRTSTPSTSILSPNSRSALNGAVA